MTCGAAAPTGSVPVALAAPPSSRAISRAIRPVTVVTTRPVIALAAVAGRSVGSPRRPFDLVTRRTSDASLLTPELPFPDRSVVAIREGRDNLLEHGRLLRLPQEDCCQALSVPPSRKYQSDGGPGIVQILHLLTGSDTPDEDRKTVFKAQILFWLIGATDGHAKNFSVFLGPGGSYSLTPLYDVLTAQPSLDARQIERKQMKLAMAVGEKNHYRIDGVLGRHFLQTAAAAGLPKTIVQASVEEIADTAEHALAKVQHELPPRFPAFIHASVSKAVTGRIRGLTSAA